MMATRSNSIQEDTFIRDIPPILTNKLKAWLDIKNNWQKLAEQIPQKCDSIFDCGPFHPDFQPRYTSVQIEGIERAGNKANGSPTKSLLKDWGKKNSKIKHLLLALNRANLLEPSKIVSQHLATPEQRIENSNLQESFAEPPKECLVLPPESIRETDILQRSTDQNETGINRLSVNSEPGKSVVEGAPIQDELPDFPECPDFSQFQQKIDFKTLKIITNNFDENHITKGGRLIGEGGFGRVYLGIFQNDQKVAIKQLKQTGEEISEEQNKENLDQFETEVKVLSNYKHENVVLLLGYSLSMENEDRCLVYQYMENGSLEERLAQRFDTPPLSIDMRLEIIKGTAQGISYLNSNGLVHRDIKSANILLDRHYSPKIGDFATAKVMPTSTLNQTFELQASKVIGTAPYLAPEALDFNVHPKLDSFSFGVVLLEILTGLPVIDETRRHVFLRVYVQEFCCILEDDDEEVDEDEPSGTIFDLLDNSGGEWNKDLVEKIYELSEQCLEHTVRRRPKIADILRRIDNLSNNEIFSD